MWQFILDIFEKHTLLNKLSARWNLYTVTVVAGEFILQFTTRVWHLASSLKSINVTIDDEELAITTLNGVPACIDRDISALNALGTEERSFSFDFV